MLGAWPSRRLASVLSCPVKICGNPPHSISHRHPTCVTAEASDAVFLGFLVAHEETSEVRGL